MIVGYKYTKGVSLGPAIAIRWNKRGGTPYDFSTGFTFFADVTPLSAPGTLLRHKTANITGSNGAPDVNGDIYNAVIDWDTADHTPLPADGAVYRVLFYAVPSAGDTLGPFHGDITFSLETAPV